VRLAARFVWPHAGAQVLVHLLLDVEAKARDVRRHCASSISSWRRPCSDGLKKMMSRPFDCQEEGVRTLPDPGISNPRPTRRYPRERTFYSSQPKIVAHAAHRFRSFSVVADWYSPCVVRERHDRCPLDV
jgi:hypothetical protein